MQEISLQVQQLLSRGTAPAQHIQAVVILIAACYTIVHLCLFQLKPISFHLTRNFRRGRDSLLIEIPLNVPEILETLHFQLNIQWVGRLGFGDSHLDFDYGHLPLGVKGSPRWSEVFGVVGFHWS